MGKTCALLNVLCYIEYLRQYKHYNNKTAPENVCRPSATHLLSHAAPQYAQ